MGRKSGINKLKVGFSIDIETYQEFEQYCEENFINRSKLMDKILKDFLKSQKKQKYNICLNQIKKEIE